MKEMAKEDKWWTRRKWWGQSERAEKGSEDRNKENKRRWGEKSAIRAVCVYILTSMFLSLHQPRSKETKVRHKTRWLQGDIIWITTTILMANVKITSLCSSKVHALAKAFIPQTQLRQRQTIYTCASCCKNIVNHIRWYETFSQYHIKQKSDILTCCEKHECH